MNLSNTHIFILRLVMAALFLHLGITKIDAGWLQSPEKLLNSLDGFHQKASGVNLRYLDAVAIPYAQLWSKLMALGETAIGLSLLLGLLIRLSSAIGIFAVVNFHAASGNLYSLAFFGSPSGALIVAGFVILLMARAGRWNGVDQILAQKNSTSVLW